MKKMILCSLTGVLLIGAITPTTVVLASENSHTYSEEKILNNDGTLELAKDGLASDFEVISIKEYPIVNSEDSENLITPYAIINDGGYTWKKINTRKASNKVSNSVVYHTANFLVDIVLTYFGAKIIKSAVKISEISAAVASTSIARIPKLISQPATLYYTITTYEDYDAVNYYVKQNVKVYSNSSRTKLVSNADIISRFTKK